MLTTVFSNFRVAWKEFHDSVCKTTPAIAYKKLVCAALKSVSALRPANSILQIREQSHSKSAIFTSNYNYGRQRSTNKNRISPEYWRDRKTISDLDISTRKTSAPHNVSCQWSRSEKWCFFDAHYSLLNDAQFHTISKLWLFLTLAASVFT